MKGLEPSTFCMASRRSSQLSYIRVLAMIAALDPAFAAGGRPPPIGPLRIRGRVQHFVHQAVGELVFRAPDGAVADASKPPRQASGLERELP
jgi:hypothetical protein